MTDKIRQALAGMIAIVDESTGVTGYHLNGNIAEWGEFPEVDAARDALAQPHTKDATPEGWRDVIEETRDNICAGGDGIRSSMERNIVEPYLDGIYDELEALEKSATPAAPAQAVRMCQTMQRPVTECGCPDCGSSLIDWPAPADHDPLAELRQAVAECDALPRRSGHAITVSQDELRAQRRVWAAIRKLIDQEGTGHE